jgi:hypothetical protein
MSWVFFIARGPGDNGSKSDQYHCVQCGAVLGSAAHRISVLGRPPRQTYTNPHGIACDIVTLSACQGYHPAAHRSTENTWFDGYAWRPLGCGGCGGFLGWRFEATSEATSASPSKAHGGPRRFYGLLTDRLLVG